MGAGPGAGGQGSQSRDTPWTQGGPPASLPMSCRPRSTLASGGAPALPSPGAAGLLGGSFGVGPESHVRGVRGAFLSFARGYCLGVPLSAKRAHLPPFCSLEETGSVRHAVRTREGDGQLRSFPALLAVRATAAGDIARTAGVGVRPRLRQGALRGFPLLHPGALSEAHPSRQPLDLRAGRSSPPQGPGAGAGRRLQGALDTGPSRIPGFFGLRALPPSKGQSQCFRVFTETCFHFLTDGPGVSFT